MSVILSIYEESSGRIAAQTGNLVHSAIHAFHTQKDDRVAQGLAALAAAREQFPEGDETKAIKIYRAYTADPENANAIVPWCEQQVTLRLEAPKDDPTGQPIVIIGTLDQVRLHSDGIKRVHDIKTGERFGSDETVTEYLVQQAVYTLAARQSLDASILPGGIIYTPGYEKTRARRHIPVGISVEECIILVQPLVHWVSMTRRGHTLFQPTAESCRFCESKPYPKCVEKARCLFGSSIVG